MNKRLNDLIQIREKLQQGDHSIGSWIQIPHPSIAEIMGQGGYDWVAVDMEHGSISVHQLPDLFRALELGGTLPLARLSCQQENECKAVLDAGAGGVIVPMIKSSDQLIAVRDACRWPPAGRRGVGFSRANLFGANFKDYQKEACAPLLVAMIEHYDAIENLNAILAVDGLDAILIGPYDLSASMGLTGDFDHPDFSNALNVITNSAIVCGIPAGIHVIEPSSSQLEKRIKEGYRFIAYSIDAIMLQTALFAQDH